MSPFTRLLSPICIEFGKTSGGAYTFDGCALLGVHSLPQIVGFALLLAPTLAVDLALVLAVVLGPRGAARRPLQALGAPLAPNSLVCRIARGVGRVPARDPYAALTLAPEPTPTTLLSLFAPRVRPAHVASELEVFWTGRGGSFALSFLALSLSARVLLVFVLFGLG